MYLFSEGTQRDDDTKIYNRSIKTEKVSVFFWHNSLPPQRAMASSFMRFLDHTQRRTTVGRTPLDE